LGKLLGSRLDEASRGSYHKLEGVEKKAARQWKPVALIAIGFVIGIVAVVFALPHLRRERSLSGAVLIANEDPRKQLPVPNVQVTITIDGTSARAKSDASGYYRLIWRGEPWGGREATLTFAHPEYLPLEVTQGLRDEFYIARLKPAARPPDRDAGPEVPVKNIRIRYAVKASTTVNVGSTTKTFEVVNTGNVPCERKAPCSPDGKWKAAIGAIELDAGESQEFQNVRVSCIAGPCPFTKIENDGFSHGGRKISVTVRAWSDTVTFLVESEVIRTMLIDTIRQAYPSIFGRVMTFTMPPTGQGPSIEAEVKGLEIVFPLGPDLKLSWASCTAQVAPNRTKLYSCELNAGYIFR
jgi:hypothetical protein